MNFKKGITVNNNHIDGKTKSLDSKFTRFSVVIFILYHAVINTRDCFILNNSNSLFTSREDINSHWDIQLDNLYYHLFPEKSSNESEDETSDATGDQEEQEEDLQLEEEEWPDLDFIALAAAQMQSQRISSAMRQSDAAMSMSTDMEMSSAAHHSPSSGIDTHPELSEFASEIGAFKQIDNLLSFDTEKDIQELVNGVVLSSIAPGAYAISKATNFWVNESPQGFFIKDEHITASLGIKEISPIPKTESAAGLTHALLSPDKGGHSK